MASAIEILVKQAIKTFQRKAAGAGFEENLARLKSLVDKITADDVTLDRSLATRGSSKAPVSYIEIYEDKYLTVGIFVLKPGCCLPLHDHPKMHGILKVLTGKLNIQSYTVIENCIASNKDKAVRCIFPGKPKGQVLAEKHQNLVVSANDGSCLLNEIDRNLHEIKHVEGQYAAFLDVLAPPYSGNDSAPCFDGIKRECHYFEPREEVMHQGTPCSWLKTIPSPSTFWSDQAPYFGPVTRSSQD